jgi:acyl-ACP thioesterase
MLARTEAFAVHSYEVDAFGTLAVPALSGYLSEVAGLHAAELGVGLEALMARGLTWVLVRQRIENPAPVRLGDTIEIETWPSGVDRLAAVREFVVRRGAEEVARATTHWFVLDVATRRPVRPAEVLDPRFPREARPPAVPLARGKLPELHAWDLQRRFHVRYSDIDVNLHVTNTSYVAWAIEAVPRDLWQSSRLAAVEVQFIAETRHGAAVLSRLAAAGEGAPPR